MGIRGKVIDRGNTAILYCYDEASNTEKAITIIRLNDEKYYPLSFNFEPFIKQRIAYAKNNPEKFTKWNIDQDINKIMKKATHYYLNAKGLLAQ